MSIECISYHTDTWIYQRRSVAEPFALHVLATRWNLPDMHAYTEVSVNIYSESIPVLNADYSINHRKIEDPGMFPALVWDALSKYGIELTDDDILQLYNAWLDIIVLL